MLVDQYGRPLESVLPQPEGMRGGWVLTSGIGQSPAPASMGLYGVSREAERLKSRIAYWLNPVYWAVLQVVRRYVVGDRFSWGDHPDKRVREVVDDFAAVNNLPDLAKRMDMEFMLDGENGTVWIGELTSDRPAQVAMLDVQLGVDLTHSIRDGVTQLKTDTETWDAGEFTWTAFDALYNDPRGWPVARHAVDACVAYINLLNYRLRAQDINAHLNAVYKALINTKTADGGAAQQEAKSAMYRRLPPDGAVVTLAIDKDSGREESLELLDLAKGAIDAASDARLIRLVTAVVVGVPEHWLGEGGNANRSTSEAMTDPALKAMEDHQGYVRSWGDHMLRTELVRRDGPNRRYTVKKVTYRDDGRTRSVETRRVPASQIEIPWVFPDITSDDLAALTTFIDKMISKRVMSMQSARERAGLDPAVEVERLGREAMDGDKPPAANSAGDANDDAFADRIAHADDLAQGLNVDRPGLGLHWAHIITGPGAETAPGAYLQGALPKTAPGEPAPIGEPEATPKPAGDDDDSTEDAEESE